MQRAWIIVLLAACSRGTPTTAPDGPTTKPVLANVKSDPTIRPRAPLDGLLQVQPEAMCGGAQPPDHYVPPPLAPAPKVVLRILAGDRYSEATPVIEVTTAADGTFTANLPAGRYCIARAGRGPKPTPTGRHYDHACQIARWEACEATVEIPVKARLAIDIVEPCQWSICYSGPPPP